MFLDRITVYVRAGDGGDGCVSFRKEYKTPKGGPNGGDGGKGGDVIIRAERNVDSLAHMAGIKHWRAVSGSPGMGNNCTGKQGDDLSITVPVGTLIRDASSAEILADLTEDQQEFIVAKGGRGGRGNKPFATPINRAPREFEYGEPGVDRHITLELKVIADVGLVGKPNAGKSTLLSRITNATPEIAAYPFTTKYPNLGIVQIGDDTRFVVADIPGLIEGAHAGVGLGHEFLRHVERTKLLVHLVEPEPADGTDPIENYRNIRDELRLYDATLVERPEIVVISKCEFPASEEVAKQLSAELQQPVLRISAATGAGLNDLFSAIMQHWQLIRESIAIR